MNFTGVALNDLPRIAKEIVDFATPKKLWAFYGEMGAGKTTLIKQICKIVGVEDEISSPTYSLVNEYKTASGNTIYHFDFYRIRNIAEAYDIGYEDYFFSGNICLIEWPQNIETLLEGEDVLKVSIDKTGETRTVTLE